MLNAIKKVEAEISAVNALSTLTSGKIIVGSAGAVPTAVTPSGDVTISNTGVLTIGPNKITPIKMGTRIAVALSDAAATPNISQLVSSSIFTMTPTAARTFTTPTAAQIVAGITGATVGTNFDFLISNAGHYAITVTAGDGGVTITGDAAVNKGAATFRALLTNVGSGTEAVTIYRTNDAVVSADAPLTNTHILVGDANGQAADVALSGDATLANTGAMTLSVPKVKAIVSQSLVRGSFTDDAGTSGHIDIATQIPAGSIVLGWKAVVSAGFTGDTTAIVQVGISGTVDKYSVVTTGSVVAAATVGASPKAANQFESAAITARVTVTGTADFTSISAGTMVVTLYVIQTQ